MINPLASVSEHTHQVNVVAWFSLQYPLFDKLFFAIPNGGARHKAVAGKLKAEGVKAGVADLFLSVGRGGFFGLYLEMKSEDGKLSDEQRKFRSAVESQNYCYRVAHGFDQALAIIKAYLEERLQ